MKPRFLALTALLLLLVAAPAHAGVSSWTHTSAPPKEELWTRAFESDGGTVYSGTEGDGVFRSTNGGVSWEPLSDGLTAAGAKDIRIIETVGGTLFTGTGAGLYKLSGGAWQPVAQGGDIAPEKRLVKPVQALVASGDALLAGVASGGVYRSTDGGATWTRPAAGNGMISSETVWGLTAHPLTPNTILAATSGGVYGSTDNGVTWVPRNDGIPFTTTLRVVVHPSFPNTYFASTLDGVYRTVNAGETWAAVNGGLTDDTVRGVFLHDYFRMYVATENGVFVSDNLDAPDPSAVEWRHVTNAGLGANTVMWALGDGFFGANTLLAGTQSFGSYLITLVPPQNTQDPFISGTKVVGGTLTANVGGWNGTPDLAYEIQWLKCPGGANCQPVPGMTGSEWILEAADQNASFKIEVRARNPFPGPGVAETSGPYGTITANPNPLPTAAAPTVTAPTFPFVGDTLSATAPTWSNSGVNSGFQWLRCDGDATAGNCLPIIGATSSTYTLGEGDVGHKLRVFARGKNNAGTGTTGDSSPTVNAVYPGQAKNTAPPAIAGDAWVGETLVGSVGAWKSPRTRYQRQWLVCEPDGTGCNPIADATGPAHTVQATEKGKVIRLRVRADTNGFNEIPDPVTLESAPTAVVTDPPAPPSPPGPNPPALNPPTPTPPDKSAPAITALKATAKSFKRGKKIGFDVTVSEASTLTVVFQRVRPGRRKGGKCMAPSRKLRKKPKCLRLKSSKPVRATAPAGKSRHRFATSRKLAVGVYRFRVVARDAAGNASAAKLATYRIKRR